MKKNLNEPVSKHSGEHDGQPLAGPSLEPDSPAAKGLLVG